MGQLFTLPGGVPFLPALAEGLLAGAGGAIPLDRPPAERLAGVTVLLPTRRAARGLVEALVDCHGGALLLPAIRPIGDVDEDLPLAAPEAGGPAGEMLAMPPAIAGLHRTMALARLIIRHARATGLGPTDPAQAVPLAGDLARVLDAFATEEADLSRLPSLVPDGFAEYWQRSLAFLDVITSLWPRMLDETGHMDPAARRTRALDALTAAWTAAPPGPVIAAGSTGSIPATARLLSAIAGMPQGAVVLPGLDMDMDADTWAATGAAHPQYGMHQLLARMGRTRADVAPWPAGRASRAVTARLAFVSEALRPAETTDGWRDADKRFGNETLTEAFGGVSTLVADNPQIEALAIALAMREALETPGKSAALVTPDRALARRVCHELARWGIEAEDTGGTPLGHTPPGSFLLLLGEMAAERLAPVPLLSVLKHPLTRLGMEAPAVRGAARTLDSRVLRGPRPASGCDGLHTAIAAAAARRHAPIPPATAQRLAGLVDRLAQAGGRFFELMALETAPFAALLTAHLETAEALAQAGAAGGAARLWDGEAGEVAAAFAAEALEHADLMGDVPCASYPALLGALMAGRAVRPVRRSHPRVHILGPLEARLTSADRVILGGLNEGVWPARAEVDAWLNRPMRTALGLEPPERQIGLAAHDVAQGLGAPEVILTRAERSDGQPTVPSRWWLRLENLARGLGVSLPEGPWAAWAVAKDRPRCDGVPALRPAPCPPVPSRPRQLSVTRINTLFRDPYSIYAQYVLGLRVLDPLDEAPGASDRGTVIHQVLEDFVAGLPPGPLSEDALPRLLALGEAAFAAAGDRPEVRAIWQPRFADVAAWFVDWERARRADVAASHLEVKGRLEIPLRTGPFAITAEADRIDVLADGRLALLDYKTGTAPTDKETAANFSIQLPLEQAMAERGAFEGVPAAHVRELTYLELKGGRAGCEAKPVKDPDDKAARALHHAQSLLAQFEEETTPYLSRPRPQFLSYEGDYDHLARVREWQTAITTD